MSESVSSNMIDDIDESGLSGESRELYVFQWLSSLERQCKSAAPEMVKAKQSSLETTLMRIIGGVEPYPQPGRALRDLTARCLVVLYSRGDSKALFDMLPNLIRIAGDVRVSDKDMSRIASFFCIGDLMLHFGSQVMSFMSEILALVLKTVKSSASCLIRYHSLVALRKSISTAKKAVNESMHKDITKQIKVSLSDKCLPLQRAAADLLLVLHDPPDINTTLGEIEYIVSICVRGLDSADQPTRQSFARLVGHLLASTQVERSHSTSESHAGRFDGADDGMIPPSHGSVEKKFTLSLEEMLGQLSMHFNKPSTSRKTRVGVFQYYTELLLKLGGTFVESNYGSVVGHFMTEIVANPRNSTTRYESLLVRKLVEILLRNLVGVRMLGEQSQIAALQELSRSYLKRWPAIMPGQVSPSNLVLAVVLEETAGLLQQLGNTPPPVQDALAEPLITLLAHPSKTICIRASRALQAFCFSTPLCLPKTILTVLELLHRDLNALVISGASPDTRSRALGHGYGLAALISLIPERPLYVSYDASAKVLDMAVQLLKRAGDHDIDVAEVEIEVAWTSIASLMSLGPTFVRPHLPQLLVLWRNALPKPTTKDFASISGRTTAGSVFLLHVRECALGALLCFLQCDTSLVTLDVARRIASVLSNALAFVSSVPVASEPSESHTSTSDLHIWEDLLLCRVYQCFVALGIPSVTDSIQSILLQSVVPLFAGPDAYTGSSVQASIASSSGAFTSIWQVTDGYAYGLTSLDILKDDPHEEGSHRDNISLAIDSLLRKPVLGTCEYDPLSVCDTKAVRGCLPTEAPPAATAVVDSAIRLFSELFVLQDPPTAVRILTQIIESVRSTKLEKNAGRKAAVVINVAVAVALSLRCATANSSRRVKDIFGDEQVVSLLSSFLKDILGHGDPCLRSIASESIGRLGNFAGPSFLTSQVKLLVDQVVSNRDPYGRAGCAFAFGAIHSHMGGLAAGPLLKTTVNVLMSLGSDPHPLVHFSALNALAHVANAASLSYSPFVSSTLGMLFKVFLLESHEREGGALTHSHLRGDFPAYPALCRIIDAVITISGPDLQESPRTKALVLNLVNELSVAEDEAVAAQALNCIQHLLMFTPMDIQVPDLVNQFRGHISSPRRPLKLASINALYQLVQRDALSMSKLGGDQLVEDLFLMLDDDPSVPGVRDVISSWLQQTVIHNPSAWIDLCQRIMSRTTASQRVADAIASRGVLHDDEGMSLARIEQATTHGRITCRWRTQLFALECLHTICTTVAQSGRAEHLDSKLAEKIGLATTGLLVTRVSDLVKIAFTASTAYITEIRLEALVVLRDVIEIFASVSDPVYNDALLLEQYQAPITAALTPAMTPESTPEIFASAIRTSALFVGCGIVKDVARMSRILKMLTSALQQSSSPGMLSSGDDESGQFSPNASAMLRIATLSAWARLAIASSKHKHLLAICDPLRETLIPMWIGYLRDYAIIRAHSEFMNDPSVMLDLAYSSLGKEVLLPYYLDSWQFVLRAVAAALGSDDAVVFAALHGNDTSLDRTIIQGGTEGPAIFFFVIIGLAFEALSSPADSTVASNHEETMIAALQVIKCLLQRKYSGNAMTDLAVLEELIGLCYRIAMTDTPVVQVQVIELLIALPSSSNHSNKYAHCFQICAFLLRNAVVTASPTSLSQSIDVIVAVFKAFYTIANSDDYVEIREDIRSVAIYLYSELLKDESTRADLVTPTLHSLKSLLHIPLLDTLAMGRFNHLVNNLLSVCLLNISQMRMRQGAISEKKIRGNLLVAVLLLTTVPPTVSFGQKAVEHTCYLICESLMDMQDNSLTAAQCAKTVITGALSGNQVLCQCSKIIVPVLVEYILKVTTQELDKKLDRTQCLVLDEIWKSFMAILRLTNEIHKASFLGVILPVLAHLFQCTHLGISQSQVSAWLLVVASSSSALFRAAVMKLDTETRVRLEQEIRGLALPLERERDTAPPQITLRLFSL